MTLEVLQETTVAPILVGVSTREETGSKNEFGQAFFTDYWESYRQFTETQPVVYETGFYHFVKDPQTYIDHFNDGGYHIPEGHKIDSYNSSSVVELHGRKIQAARIEPRSFPIAAGSYFFDVTTGVPEALIVNGEHLHIDEAEDPRLIVTGKGELIASVVNVNNKGYRQVFYEVGMDGKFKRLGQGPEGEKGIAISERPDGEGFDVYTRPFITGNNNGHLPVDKLHDFTRQPLNRGHIAYLRIDSLKELNPETLKKAQPINMRFVEKEWGGVNVSTPLEKVLNVPLRDPIDRSINFILMHRAFMGPDKKYAIGFMAHNSLTGEVEDLGIAALRQNFPAYAPKIEELRDVVYPSGSGFVISENGKIIQKLDAGASDSASVWNIGEPNNLTENYFKRKFVF